MSSPSKRLCLSLEPAGPVVVDGHENDLFARPARLLDVNLEDATKTFTRDDPKKGLGDRLKRIWAERGDFSQVTTASITTKQLGKQVEQAQDEKEKEKDKRRSADELKQLSQQMMEQLAIARGEMQTALDMLFVISPPSDPPVDPAQLALAPHTLSLVPTSAQPQPPTSQPSTSDSHHLLPLATSIRAVHSSATAFLNAASSLASTSSSSSDDSEPVASTSQNPWPSLLALRAKTAYSILPIGAQRGAALTGKGEGRIAKEVGVFYGCQEAKEVFRRQAVVRMQDLESDVKSNARVMVIRLEREGFDAECSVLDCDADGDLESRLRTRARGVFAEEIFATLSNEVRTDQSIKGELVIGKRSEGDSVVLEGHEWTLRISLISATSSKLPMPTSSNTHSETILALVRLLYLQEYARRREVNPSSWSRPILPTLSILLQHQQRLSALDKVLADVATQVKAASLEVKLEYWSAGGSKRAVGDLSLREEVKRILGGEKDIGGRAVLRVAKKHSYHISYSLIVPSAPPQNPRGMPWHHTHQSLVLQPPNVAPIPVPSISHLELFLSEQMKALSRDLKRSKAKAQKMTID